MKKALILMVVAAMMLTGIKGNPTQSYVLDNEYNQVGSAAPVAV